MNHFVLKCLHFLTLMVSLGISAPVFDLSGEMKPPQMKILYPPHQLQPGDRVHIQVTLDSGWHINADDPKDEFLLPTILEIQAQGLDFGPAEWPQPHRAFNEALQMEVLSLAGMFTIKVPIINIQNPYDSLTTQATLKFQACSNTICLAPSEVQATMPQETKKKVPSLEIGHILWMLLLAWLGGMILNLMPCVLPVLSIKALSLAQQSRSSRKRLVVLSLSMTLGILVSFWTLASIVIVMQQAGEHAGWGFQFQNPAFLVLMSVLMTLFALNLFGVFEIWLPSHTQTSLSIASGRSGLMGAFLNGVLMTLLSTPCSAPFLGSAMGFAFTQPPALLLLFFSATGLGLATPFLLLSIMPKALRWLPKPGKWMIHFKQFLGFLLLITAVWLLWVLGRQVGLEAMGSTLNLLVLLGLGAWILGLVAAPGNAYWKVVLGWMLVGALGYGVWIHWISPILQTPPPTEHCSEKNLFTPDHEGWITWTPATMDSLLTQNRIVFVDFTADWCLTCKTNEKAVLSQDTIQQLFAQYNVIKVKADWTRPNPDIAQALKAFGRGGVPLYVVYPSHDPKQPKLLPEILTTDLVIQALHNAHRAPSATVPEQYHNDSTTPEPLDTQTEL